MTGTPNRMELFAFAEQFEVRPQCAPDKPNSTDLHRVTVKYVNVGPGFCFQIVDERQVVFIVFMIARHIDNGLVGEMPGGPLDAA